MTEQIRQREVIFGYLELAKPRILSLVLVTTALGFFLGGEGITSWSLLLTLLAGSGLVCAGSSMLNHYLERDSDRLMVRTRNRPLPRGLIPGTHAMLLGIALILAGVFLLCWRVNLLTAFLSLLTAFLYVLVYTPMKKVSWLNTAIGAVPGALPPMGGWAAATGDLAPGAWALFLILFAWQHPHFYSIAWMFRDDYKRAGFKMLPVVYPDGKSMFRQINIFALLLIPISLLPTILGISGWIYFWGAIILGTAMLWKGFVFSNSKTIPDARLLLRASVIYLPVLLFLIIFDASF